METNGKKKIANDTSHTCNSLDNTCLTGNLISTGNSSFCSLILPSEGGAITTEQTCSVKRLAPIVKAKLR